MDLVNNDSFAHSDDDDCNFCGSGDEAGPMKLDTSPLPFSPLASRDSTMSGTLATHDSNLDIEFTGCSDQVGLDCKDGEFFAVHFGDCVLKNVKFDNCKFTNVSFKGCVLIDVTWSNIVLEEVELMDCTFTDHMWQNAKRFDVSLAGEIKEQVTEIEEDHRPEVTENERRMAQRRRQDPEWAQKADGWAASDGVWESAPLNPADNGKKVDAWWWDAEKGRYCMKQITVDSRDGFERD